MKKKQFQKYIESPFFNTNNTLVDLWMFLPTKFSVERDEINSVRIWKKLNMTTAYTDDAMRKLLSKLNQLAEDFIAYQEYNNPTEKQVFFLKACNERKLSKHFAAADRQTKSVVSKNDYLNNFCIDYYRDVDQYQNDEQRTHLYSALNNLTNFYIYNKLQLYVIYFSARCSQNMPYEAVGFKHFSQYADEKINKNLMFRFYHCMASVFDKEKTDKLNQLWQILEDSNEQSISHNQRKMIYKGIRSQLTIKYNAQGKLDDAKDLAYLYEIMEQKGYLFEKNKKNISVFQYKQAVVSHARLGKEGIEWALDFMNSNKKFVPKEHQEAVYLYCLAYCHFAQKQYKASVEQLQKIDEYDIEISKISLKYLMHHRFLALQNYYELDELENVLIKIATFREALQNAGDAIPRKMAKAYSNAISMLNNIMKLRQGDQKKGSAFGKKIEENLDIYARNWLLEKLNLKLKPRNTNTNRRNRTTYFTSQKSTLNKK